jgi:hypothetical protein
MFAVDIDPDEKQPNTNVCPVCWRILSFAGY